jgi:lysozyme
MSVFDIIKLKNELIRDEARRAKPYQCSAGKLTIGVGWNLDDNGLPDDIIEQLFDISIANAENDAKSLFGNYSDLSPARQRVVINMAFNLGRKRLSGFKKMIAAVESGDWQEATEQMLDSRWSHQVGKRSWRLADMMRDG